MIKLVAGKNTSAHDFHLFQMVPRILEETQKDTFSWTMTMQRGNFVADRTPEVTVQMNGTTTERSLVTELVHAKEEAQMEGIALRRGGEAVQVEDGALIIDEAQM